MQRPRRRAGNDQSSSHTRGRITTRHGDASIMRPIQLASVFTTTAEDDTFPRPPDATSFDFRQTYRGGDIVVHLIWNSSRFSTFLSLSTLE